MWGFSGREERMLALESDVEVETLGDEYTWLDSAADSVADRLVKGREMEEE